MTAGSSDTVAVFGPAPELESVMPPDVVLIDVVPGAETILLGHLPSAVVLDLRVHDALTLRAARRAPLLAGLPALVLSASDVSADVLDLLEATDTIVLPARSDLLARRLDAMIELGRARTALRVCEQFEVERRRFERLVAMGTMVAGFAHEVRNPVAALRSIAEEVAEELAEAGITIPHTGRMLQVLDRIERLVRTSLQLGHPTIPRRALHRPWTILSSAISEVGPRTRAAGGELRIEVEPELPDVYCDDAQIAQALAVLVNNALDAVGAPGRVTLRATRLRPHDDPRGRKSSPPPGAATTGWVRLDVCDDGPGIDPEIVDRIFDPFFTTKASGTGLGLSIAQQIVGENQGRLEVASSLGGPTVFTIVVPAEP